MGDGDLPEPEKDAMMPPRRQFLHLVAGAAALPAVSRFAWAQTYPTQPVRIIVDLAPCGTTDIVARLIGQWLSERLGQQFVIENRPGAGAGIVTRAVVSAPVASLRAEPIGGGHSFPYQRYDFFGGI